METPYLNDTINELEIHLRNDELSTLGKEHLTEFKNIKKQLTLNDVSQQRELLVWLQKSDLVTFPKDEINEVIDDYIFLQTKYEY